MKKRYDKTKDRIKLRLLGVRGSRPSHRRDLLVHGGNSTALEIVVNDDFYLFIDGGSGLVHRGIELGETSKHEKFHILITHTHWDHILGLPFFEPMYHPKNQVNFYASNTSRATFYDLFFGLQRAQNLPVPSSQFKAKLKFETIKPDQCFLVENKVRVETFQLNHQGVTLAFKITNTNDSVVIITDNAPMIPGNWIGEGMQELAEANPSAFMADFEQRLVTFLTGVHTVVFDSHFTEKNLKPDWGHTTAERALEFCIKAGNKRLILFHHAPEDSDTQVDAKVQGIFTKALRHGIEVVAAREGDEWNLRCA